LNDSGSSAPTDAAPGEPSRDDPEAESVAGRPRRRSRWRVWLPLLAALLVLRLAFSVILGPLLEARLSRVLGAEVEIGDVSFSPIDAVFTLRGVTVQGPGWSPAEEGAPPAIAAARVLIDAQWLPLLHRSLLVREVAFESASIDLERLRGAGSSLEEFIRVDPTPELPAGWTFALDRVVLRDTKVRLRGLAVGDPAALEVGVRDAQVSTLARRASAFGRAPNLRIDAVVEGGRIRIDGSSDLEDRGVVIDSLIRVKDVPIARLTPYLEGFGWSVAGRLSGQLHYQRDPGRRDLLTGRLRLRRIAAQVPALDEPAFAVRRAEVELDALDLLQRRVTVGSLTLHGARLALRPDLGAPIPLLDGVRLAPEPAPRGRRPARPPAVSAAAPWSWTIGHLATPFARLHVAGSDGAVVVLAASVSGESIGPGAYWSPLRAWIGRGGGVAVFDGTARMTRGLTIDGRLTASGVDAPAFARTFGMPFADLAQTGLGAADLTLEIEPGAAKDPVDVRGKVTVSDVWLAGPEPGAFAIGAGALQLTVAAISPGGGDGADFVPATVRISDATVTSPYALLTRTPEGWLLPPFVAEPIDDGSGDPGDGVSPSPVPSPATAATVAAAEAEAPVPAVVVPRAQLIVAAVRSRGGRVLLVDRAAEPPVGLDLVLTEGWAQDLRLPAVTLGNFVLQGSDPRWGTLLVGGARHADRRELEVSVQSLPLAAAAPYFAQAGLPYRFTAGTGSFLSRVSFAGGRWSADTTLKLHEPRLGGGEAELRQALGMPVEVALAALRDADGDVTFQLPLSSPGDDGGRPLADVVAGAVRDAVARARQAPLPEAPIQIAFSPGRAELSTPAARQLASLAELLAARRDVVVELSGAISSADRRWLAEQVLATELDEPAGFMRVLRAIGVRDQQERIRNALEERSAGKAGQLDADDEAALAELVAEGPPIADDRLAALVATRLTRVASALADQHGVAAARVVVAQPSVRETAAPPAVRARISVDPRSWQAAPRREVARP